MGSPIDLFCETRDDFLDILKIGRFRGGVTGTSVGADGDHKLMNYFLSILTCVGFVWSSASIYFGTESNEEFVTEFIDQILAP